MLKDLQHTIAVMAGIQARQAEHAEWLASHHWAMLEIREAGRQTDARIDKLVSAIGKLLAKDS